MTTLRHWIRLAVLASLVATPLTTARATPVYTSGHADIGVGYHDGALDPHWHTHAGAVVSGSTTAVDGEYAPNALIASGTATQPASSFQATLLGVAAGTQVGVMGSPTNEPEIGWAADELDPAQWTGPITITFNPGASTFPSGGAFALATTGGTPLFSSVVPGATSATNTFTLDPGTHNHYEWFFSGAGSYGLNFTWSGQHVTDGLKTASATFTVQAVPEPSTVAMLAMAGGTAALAVIRRVQRSGRLRSA